MVSSSSSSSSPSLSRRLASLASLALTAAALAGCGGSSHDPVPASSVKLTASGSLPPNCAIASLSLVGRGAGVALVSDSSSSGPRADVLFPFNPFTGAVGASVSAQAVVTTGTAIPDENGTPITSWTTSFPAFAAAASSKLYVTTSNSAPPTFAFQPGSVLVYDYDASAGAIGATRTPIVTARGGKVFYNPTWIGSFERTSGVPLVAVVCAGTFGFSVVQPEAAVLVIDPATDTIAESVTFAARTASPGEAVISSDLRLYVGGTGFAGAADAAIYVIDLSTSPPTVRHGDANPIALPTSSGAQNVGDLALSTDQSTLYALNGNDGALHVLARTGAGSADTPSHVTRVANMKRGASNDFASTTQSLAVRPGFPGVEFVGPDVAVGTIKIEAAKQVLTDVQTAVDAIDTTKTNPTVLLDALVSPFQVHDDIQHMRSLRFGQRKAFLYVAQSKSGTVVVADWDALK